MLIFVSLILGESFIEQGRKLQTKPETIYREMMTGSIMETGIWHVLGSGPFLHVLQFHLVVLDLHVFSFLSVILDLHVFPFLLVVLDLHVVRAAPEISDQAGDLCAQSLEIELRNLEVGLYLRTLLNSLQVN